MVVKPFREEERIQLREVMMEETFTEAPTRRTQIAVVYAILHDTDDLLRFTSAAIGYSSGI
jgi:hypothetical protein